MNLSSSGFYRLFRSFKVYHYTNHERLRTYQGIDEHSVGIESSVYNSISIETTYLLNSATNFKMHWDLTVKTLFFTATLLFIFGSSHLANGQKPTGENPPLSFSTKFIGTACLGEKFEIEGKLANISDKDVWIEKNMIWRYLTEKALDQSSSNLPWLTTPKMRSSMGDPMYIDGSEDEVIVRLRPGESYTAVIEKDPKKDGFYSLPGRYSIIYGYGQFLERSKSGVKPWKGSIYANELNFRIRSCGTIQPPPASYDEVRQTVYRYIQFAKIGKFEEIKNLTYIPRDHDPRPSTSAPTNYIPPMGLTIPSDIIKVKLEIDLPTRIYKSNVNIASMATLEQLENRSRVLVKYLPSELDKKQTSEIFSLVRIDDNWKIYDISFE